MDPQSRPLKSTNGRSMMERVVRGYFAAAQRVTPRLAAWHAARLFFTPRRGRGGAPAALQGHAAQPFRVRVGRETMRGWTYGSGPDVLFVHGWGGGARDWAELAREVVERGYRAVVADFPAHGLSTGRRTTLPEMARALHLLANELAFSGRDRFVPLEAVVAHSFGAAAAVLAARDGLLAQRFVLLAPVAHPMAFLDPFAAALGLQPAVRAGLAERIRVRAGGDLGRLEIPAAAAQVHAPALIVHDRDDRAVPWAHGRDIAAAWERAHLFSTRGLGHRGVLREERVRDAVTRFIAAPEAFRSARSAAAPRALAS